MDFNKLVHTLNDIAEGHNYDSYVNANTNVKTDEPIVDETAGATARKFVPKLGKATAKHRMNKQDAEAQEALYGDDDRKISRHARAADRYEKISQGKKPFAKESPEVDEGMHDGWGLNNRPSAARHMKAKNLMCISCGTEQVSQAGDGSDIKCCGGQHFELADTPETQNSRIDVSMTGESTEDTSDEWYDKDGNVSPNGAYDAAGHYDAERDADKEDFMSESIDNVNDILKLSGLVKESTEATEENRPWANSPSEKYLDTETMTVTLSGGPNAPHAQINPNNPGDNPLAMGSLKMNLERASLNLKEDAARIEKKLHEQYAAESKDSLAALKAKKAKIDADIEKIVSDGGKVSLTDPLTVKLNKVRADIKKAKKAK